ncbi:MAG TPA: cysteine desulfurase NifS [Deltaproteobacteria bacterium]|nr:cysteine desulfurase NifS [Deltaproteobacteria bacterium]HQJ07531.1 cysteine desulfurase NifS [Deltaproteobacteria bacterium]
MSRIYLDHAATTPVAPEVVEAMLPYLSGAFGNTSSIHSFGQEARGAVEKAREHIASFIGARPEEIVFTGSGTESDNFVIKGAAHALKDKGNHIITSAVEHHAVLETCRFLEEQNFRVTYLPVDEYGLVDPNDVEKAVTDKTILISVMHANNEIGTIEPIAEIGAIARSRGIYFHTDAVQTFGHIPVDVGEMNVDFLSASAHKLCGPKGVGMAYIRRGTRMTPLLHGGDQEKRLRASTLNVPGIIGFGRAVEIAKSEMDSEMQRLTSLRDRLISTLLSSIGNSRLNGHPVKRLPNNANISIAFAEGEGMLLSLDMEGIAVSTGSACTSSSLEPSHVLTAIGLSHELAHGSLRFTLGRTTTSAEIDRLIEVLPGIVERLRDTSPLGRKG